jgi:hypothetical protein
MVVYLPLLGCLQDLSLEPDRAVVKGAIVIKDGGGRANIRVDISQTAPSRVNQSRDLILTAAGFTDEDGSFAIATPHKGTGFFAVARHRDYHIEVGSLNALSLGGTTELDNFLPVNDLQTGDPTPITTPPTMVRKPPGQVKFAFILTEQPFGRLVNLEVMGDFNGFSKTEGLIELFDDGGDFEQEDEQGNVFFSGDSVSGDGVYIRFLDGLPPGPLRYNFLINKNLVVRDPFEEAHVNMVDENNLPVIRSVVLVK